MTLLFTTFSAVALIVRRFFLRGREGVLRMVWVGVLILSVIPIFHNKFAVELPRFSENDFFDKTSNANTPAGAAEIKKADNGIPGAANESGEMYEQAQSEQKAPGYDLIIRSAPFILTALWIAGTALFFVMPICNYRRAKKMLFGNSVVCKNKHINEVFESCKHTLKIKQNIKLQIVRDDYNCSPCAVGIINPVIFIFGDCVNFSDSKLKFIFLHEMSHIKNRDAFIKALMILTNALHWFNPITKIVSSRINEDCELACDCTVIAAAGNSMRDSYMYTILEIAERMCSAHDRAVKSALMKGGLMFNGNSGYRTLERRYENMKTPRSFRPAAITASVFIVLTVLINTIVMSSYFKTWTVNAMEGTTGSALLDDILRAYYELLPEEPITAKMIGDISSFEVVFSDLNGVKDKIDSNIDIENCTFVDFIVNGKTIPALRRVIPEQTFIKYMNQIENYYLNENSEADSVEAFTLPESDNSTIYKTKAAKKLSAFYALKKADELLPLTEVGQLLAYDSVYISPYSGKLAIMPQTEQIAAEEVINGYLLDPYASDRELALLAIYFIDAGIINSHIISEEGFDASLLALLPNLVYLNITPDA